MMSSIRYTMNMKLIFIGDPSVGKTSLLRRFTSEEDYDKNTPSTLGVDFTFKDFQVFEKTVKLQIWDTAGQEKYRSLINSYYRHSNGIIMVFDLTDKQSFENLLGRWIPTIVSNLGNMIPKFLILGNKQDLTMDRSQIFQENEIKVRTEQMSEACFRDMDLNAPQCYADDPNKVTFEFNGSKYMGY